MINSMTAFARTQQQSDAGHLVWEIRSVNHRYLDVSFRLHDSLRFLEPQLRGLLRGKIQRGRLECQLKYTNTNAENQPLLINKGLVKALLDLSCELASTHQVANDICVSHLLSWPGVVQDNQLDRELLSQNVLNVFESAVDELIHIRAMEGKSLQNHIARRLHSLNCEIDKSSALATVLAQESRKKLLSRLRGIELEVGELRVEQEIALLLARQDISEELDRLKTHSAEVSRTLESDDAAGRRLDFLMQELNREANTLSSKSVSAVLTQSAVEMKVLIEQMREQIQNIE